MATKLTSHEKRAFKTLFGKYCNQEVSLGHCMPDCCDSCPVNMAYSEIFEKFADNELRQMRIPTSAEWDALADAVNEDDNIMHWALCYSWCQDKSLEHEGHRLVRGYPLARGLECFHSSVRNAHAAFRPAFEALESDALLPDGTVVMVGTLYMDGEPVHIPQRPVWNGDVTQYIPGAELELREALEDPAFQLKAIKVGDVLIADRVMLGVISWNDLAAQGLCEL